MPVIHEDGSVEFCTRQCFVMLWYFAECPQEAECERRLLSELGYKETYDNDTYWKTATRHEDEFVLLHSIRSQMSRIMDWATAYRLRQFDSNTCAGSFQGQTVIRKHRHIQNIEGNPLVTEREAQSNLNSSYARGCWFWHPVFDSGGLRWEGDRAPASNAAELEQYLKDPARFSFGPDCKPGYFPPTHSVVVAAQNLTEAGDKGDAEL
jgi:hypothetical protein